ncbi:MAG: methyltransferase domain-containing protein [Sphingomonas sp.]|nr:methyltransferase domain-containing protein [Sphingomonas sp.]
MQYTCWSLRLLSASIRPAKRKRPRLATSKGRATPPFSERRAGGRRICPPPDGNVRIRTSRAAFRFCYGAGVSEQRHPDGPFDRALRRLRRDRAARAGADPRYLHRRAADELLERLDLVARDFRTALDLGGGDGWLAGRLEARGLDVIRADSGRFFAAGGVRCDEDRLPFADGAFDLVVSVGVLDTVNDLPGALTLIRRALRPDGLFLAAFAGAGSLAMLRAALRAAEEAEGRDPAPRLHPQIDARAAGDLLARAGFALPVVDRDNVMVRFGTFAALLRDLRGMAGGNLLLSRARRPFGRSGYAAAAAAFAARADADGKTAETFDILYLSGWAPSPDQPRPARRGSATASLADALKPKG